MTTTAPITTLVEYPINYENEALILANAIKDEINREIFVRKVPYDRFLTEKFRVVAWGIIESINSNMTVNIDSILLKSKTCPIKHELDFEFLKDLIDNYDIVPEENFHEHIAQLHTDATKAAVLHTTISSIYKTCLNPKSTISDIEKRVNHLQEIVRGTYSSIESQFKSLAEVGEEYRDYRSRHQDKYTCGFEQLDRYLTEGLAPGAITTIAALSSMGKSSFLLSIMKNLSYLKVPTAQFALEMNNMSLFMKLLSFNTRLSLNKIARHPDTLSEEERKIYEWEFQRLQNNEFMYLNDKPNQTIKNIREQIMILQDKLQTEYIVTSIDLFGKVKDLRRSDNFARDYENILNDVQMMVRELKVHMILVAQIRRDVAHRKAKRPTMADIKNSGAFTEISDLIFGLHRPFYDPDVALKYNAEYGITPNMDDYEEDPAENLIQTDPNQNIAEVILLKQRMGPNNVIVNFIFDPVTTCFIPVTDEYQLELNKMKFNDDEGE